MINLIRRRKFGATASTARTAILSLVMVFGSSSAWAQTQIEVAKLVAGDGAIRDEFGRSVAVSGDTLVVGAIGDDDSVSDSGSVYVYARGSNMGWVQQQKLTASDARQNDQFGYSVAVFGDTVVVGAPNFGARDAAVYVFVRGSSGAWTQQQKITGPTRQGGQGGQFGLSVALSSSTLVVGAIRDEEADRNTGAAFVYVRGSSGVWTKQQKLADPGWFYTVSAFGRSVAISGDTVLVADWSDDINGAYSVGSTYVFVRGSTGAWTQQQKLTASDAAAQDYFGTSVALAGDTALVGAVGGGDNGDNSGSAYVYVRGSNGVWTQQQKLTASDGAADDSFGNSVALVGDAAIVGAVYDDDSGLNSGSAYVYMRESNGVWTQERKLRASDGASADRFGGSIAVSGDTVLVSATEDQDSGYLSGSVYNFSLTPAINFPYVGTSLTGGTQSITWQPGLSEVTEYWLYAGATIDSAGYFNSGSLAPTVTNTVVTGLPTNGSPVFMRLWYRVSGDTTWYYKDTSYNANGNAPSITAPAASTQLTGPVATLTWQPGASLADEYWLYAGSTVGGAEYANSGSLGQQLTGTVTGLPLDGASPVYVRLWYRNGSTWYAVDAQYVAAAGTAPTITTPAPASVLPGSTATFNWSSGGNTVTQWWLYVGSTPQGREYFDSGSQDASTTQLTVTGLPENGTPVYATLWYRYASTGYWLSAPGTYTAANTSAVQMTSPGPGTALNGTSAAFTWTDNGSGVEEWWLYAGSTPGGTQYLDSGSLGTATTATVTGLPADQSNVYITLWYRQGTVWMFESYAYPSNP